MAENEKTLEYMASLAAKVLANPKSSKLNKKLAAALLTQAPDKEKPKKKK